MVEKFPAQPPSGDWWLKGQCGICLIRSERVEDKKEGCGALCKKWIRKGKGVKMMMVIIKRSIAPSDGG